MLIIEKVRKIIKSVPKKINTELNVQHPNFYRILIIAISFVLLLIFFFSPIYNFLNLKSYDAFITIIKKPIKESPQLVLLDIDDNTINWLKSTWPISRSYHADVVEILADFEAKAAIFDIEFLEESISGADEKRIELVKDELMNKFQNILDIYVNTTTLLKNRPLELDELWSSFNSKLSEYYLDLSEKISTIKIDNDQYFANKLKYFSKAYGTVNMLFDPDLTKEDIKKEVHEREISLLKKYGYNKKELLKSKKSHSSIKFCNISEFPVDKILNEFKSVGFTFINRDKDGTIRGINLFMEREGYLIPQLAFNAFLDIYNIKKEQLDFSKNQYLILKDVTIEDKKIDIKIPIYKGLLMINWPKGEFKEIFANKFVDGKKYHYSYYDLLNYKYVILKQFLLSLEKNFGQYPESTEEYKFYQFFSQIEKEKERLIKERAFTPELKKEFNTEYEKMLNALNIFLSFENIEKRISILPNSMEEKKEELKKAMIEVKETLNILLKARENLKKLENKICFIGHTATSTTDIGVTPFDKTFENVGVHPSVFNTILQRDFIYIVNELLVLFFSIIFFSLFVWIIGKLNSLNLTIIGLSNLIIITILLTFLFRFTNIFISPIIPLTYNLVSIILLIGIKFIITEKEKSFIRDALNKYVSPDYIDEILKNRIKLNLGGERRVCTAMFTDIQGFSSISEKFMNDPPGLVSLLKDYLSIMSDVILENKGTIDKYEGDAIIAFFGAPKEMPDHAYRACIASIRIKQAENELNKTILEKKIIDTPLLTRIGINTGDMFIGNMGTSKKFNYTMMGHSVNLASRLEGVNKQYGTYQIISEYTYQYVKDKIIARRLDRVRVVNIQTPVRLYELIALKEEIDPEYIEFLKLYERALDEFENRKWENAIFLFNEALKFKKEDSVIKIYLERCRKFIKKPPPPFWDGVYVLSMK